MKTRSRLLGLLLTLMTSAHDLPASADTTDPFMVSFANLVTGGGAGTFSFPKFDPSLGSLQTVHIECDFSGTVIGSASGVSQSDSINSTITHWVFFDLKDLADGVFIAEPSLALAAGIPDGAQNETIGFGPEFRSTTVSFDVSAGDRRFAALGGGPGQVSGSLDVFFTNTTQGYTGLDFFPGDDSGLYSGSLSIAYGYAPVPEPDGRVLSAVGLLAVLARRRYR